MERVKGIVCSLGSPPKTLISEADVGEMGALLCSDWRCAVDGDRKSMSIPDDMKAPVGEAVMCYAMAEAAAKSCCEALKPGSMAWAADKTGGQIADRLANELRNLPRGTAFKARAERAASEFGRIVGRRNDIAHALPRYVAGTTNTLHRNGEDWTVETMLSVADEFGACCLELTGLFHDHLRGLGRS
jgi:hypothetical protein